ncbi:MAG: phosphatidate cytidylyltransferase [Candidatus Marinimicrobia bacterium]|nr:phosphatidate cytidylyltransferase [Candidatus Neomarinimicrobiota bacterium]
MSIKTVRACEYDFYKLILQAIMMTRKEKTSLYNRILISAIGIPVILVLIYLGGLWFTTFIAIAVLLCTYEFLMLFKIPTKTGIFFLLLFNASLVYIAIYTGILWIYPAVFVAWTIIALVMMFSRPVADFHKAFYACASIIYPALALTSLALIRNIFYHTCWNTFEGAYILYIVLAMIWICDTLAYFMGSAYGAVKLSPKISPNKTWEGAIAGFLGSLIVALIASRYAWISVFKPIDYMVLAFITGVLGQLGDLVESAIKRYAGVKDTSRLLLDHGGALDRLDSLAFTGPWIYMYVLIRFF